MLIILDPTWRCQDYADPGCSWVLVITARRISNIDYSGCIWAAGRCLPLPRRLTQSILSSWGPSETQPTRPAGHPGRRLRIPWSCIALYLADSILVDSCQTLSHSDSVSAVRYKNRGRKHFVFSPFLPSSPAQSIISFRTLLRQNYSVVCRSRNVEKHGNLWLRLSDTRQPHPCELLVLDRHQNPIDCSLGLFPPFQKIYQNPSITLSNLLDRRTDIGKKIISFLPRI